MVHPPDMTGNAMSHAPIQEFDIQSYGCIKQASFALSPLHALIGPNDSGKSTTLRALRVLAECVAYPSARDAQSQRFVPMFGPKTKLTVLYADGLEVATHIRDNVDDIHVVFGRGKGPRWEAERSWQARGELRMQNQVHQEGINCLASARERITTATMVRFDPNALRRQARQLLVAEPIQFLDETGMGLASVYQAINSRDVDAFVAIRDKVKTLFPTVQNILVPSVDGGAVVLQARLTDNTLVPAEAMSEGLLYFLGYVALQYIAESKLFLVEEPENGLHPARIAEVMSILREISKTGQVVIATHSPLVVNELQGHEVSIVTRDREKGTQVKLLKDVPGFEDAAKVYQPGEFWVSYCDGNQEEPLLKGKLRP